MNDFLNRQLSQIRFAVSDFRNGELDLNALVHRLEAIGNAIGGKFWEDRLFPLVLDLERINSELFDKKRSMSSNEQEKINALINRLEAMSNDQDALK
jgi:hypothetical protein